MAAAAEGAHAVIEAGCLEPAAWNSAYPFRVQLYGIVGSALSNEHIREIQQLVDEHARAGDLNMTLVVDIEHSLSFLPAAAERDFLKWYIEWRMNHMIAGVTQPRS